MMIYLKETLLYYYYRAGGTFFKVGGHSGGIFGGGGGAQSLRGSVATEGQGASIHFSDWGGGKSYKNVKIVCAKYAI